MFAATGTLVIQLSGFDVTIRQPDFQLGLAQLRFFRAYVVYRDLHDVRPLVEAPSDVRHLEFIQYTLRWCFVEASWKIQAETTYKGLATFTITKQRSGPTCSLKLAFRSEFFSFSDYEGDSEVEKSG